jgi:HTH-type transcriptional regulator / antitoxin HigA
MKAKVIKTIAEYEAALARIEKLMDAAPGTPRGDELELLSLLVHDYEDKKFPIDKADPVRSHSLPDGAAGTGAERPGAAVGQPQSGVRGALRQARPESQMIRALAIGLRIPAELLLGEPTKA